MEDTVKVKRLTDDKMTVRAPLSLLLRGNDDTQLLDEREKMNKERKIHHDELAHLIEKSSQWLESIGEQAYNVRKLRVVELEGTVRF